jgi:hypothetical protein
VSVPRATWLSAQRRGRAFAFGCLALLATLSTALVGHALPNTHGPAISTWDPRGSSVVFGLGGGVTGDGSFAFKSYNANFSSSSGVLSAQFGVHYVTFRNRDGAELARGASAGGVALINLPLTPRYENLLPRTSFAFYVGGVPTALISGQLNYISVPLVLGMGLPYSPIPQLTLTPWVELSPGLNFDTHIEAVATNDAIQSAMDGTLTRDEVEDLVRDGLQIERRTTLGKRAGLSIAGHLGERVDIDVDWMLGAGHGGAMSLAAALVVRWDTLVPAVAHERVDEDEDCDAIAARYHRHCPLRRPASAAPAAAGTAAPASTHGQPLHRGASGARHSISPAHATGTRAHPPTAAPRPAPTPAAVPTGSGSAPVAPQAAPPPPQTATQPLPWAAPPPAAQPAPSATPKKPAPSAPPAAPAPASPKLNELPPLQAAPPRTP